MKLNFKSFGNGQPLIFLHGLFGCLDNWQAFAKRFENSNQIYLVDLRNHGDSPHSDDFNYHVMAEDVLGLIKNQNIKNPILAGHSMGGKVAMELVLKNPDIVDKLIIFDIAPVEYPPHHSEILKALTEINLSEIKSRNQAFDFLIQKIPQKETCLFLLKNLKRNSNGTFSWKMNLEIINQKYNQILTAPMVNNHYDKPTLFVGGQLSGYIQDSYKPLILKYFPHSSLQMIPQVGHWLHTEAPDILYDLVNNFLKK